MNTINMPGFTAATSLWTKSAVATNGRKRVKHLRSNSDAPTTNLGRRRRNYDRRWHD